MKLAIISAAALLAAAPALAASPFDGTWKGDTKTAQLPVKPQVVTIAGGVYSCTSCTPKFTVPADGGFHTLVGVPYADEASITLAPHGVKEVDKLRGKLVSEAETTISPDGKTATTHWADHSAPDGKTVTGEQTQQRVGAMTPGAHPAAGSWRTISVGNISDAALTVTYQLAGESLTMTTPNGYSYAAPLGGKPVPFKGDLAGTMITVKRTGPMTLVETDWQKGEPVSIITTTALPDGKTMRVVSHNVKQGTDTRFVMHRQ